MICKKLEGVVVEKVVKEKVLDTGEIQNRLYLRMFQKGDKMALDVRVKKEVYEKAKEGTTVVLDDIKVGAFNNTLFAQETDIND